MPELPEVETIRKELKTALVGKTIKSVEAKVPKLIKPLSAAAFNNALKGRNIADVLRRAKIIVIKLSDSKYLIVHLKMTGQLIYVPQSGKIISGGHANPLLVHQDPEDNKKILRDQFSFAMNFELPNKFTHIIFDFTDGSKLFYNDLRKFGWMKIVDQAGLNKLHDELGVEPLEREFTWEKLKSIINRYPNRKIKQILMDPALLVGVGNIYSDESCFCASLNPFRIGKKIKDAEIIKLYSCIIRILKLAIAKGGTSADTYLQLSGKPGGFAPLLKVYGREGERCKRCSGIVERKKIGGRSAHFCPKCQK